MRTGTIVYLAGAVAVPEELTGDDALERAGLDPLWTELSGSAAGFYRPEEALLALAQRGAGRVDLIRGHFEPTRGLQVAADRIRLVG